MTTEHRVGFGFDVHRFSDDPDRPLVLGGVPVPGYPGLVGHSDADVVLHAVVDAVLGAGGFGDIGEHFPDTDPGWRGAESSAFVMAAVALVTADGWVVENVDCTIVTEAPKIAPFRAAMRERVSQLVGAPVNIKASRAEGLGAIGRVEGAACWAVASLRRNGS